MFEDKVGCWLSRTETWHPIFEGQQKRHIPVVTFKPSGLSGKRDQPFLKKPLPSQPRRSSGLRLRQVLTQQPNVCKTSSRMKRLGLQRHPKVATVLEDVSWWKSPREPRWEADLYGKCWLPSAHCPGCRVLSEEGLTGWDNCPVFIFEKGYYTSRIIPSSLLLG